MKSLSLVLLSLFALSANALPSLRSTEECGGRPGNGQICIWNPKDEILEEPQLRFSILQKFEQLMESHAELFEDIEKFVINHGIDLTSIMDQIKVGNLQILFHPDSMKKIKILAATYLSQNPHYLEEFNKVIAGIESIMSKKASKRTLINIAGKLVPITDLVGTIMTEEELKEYEKLNNGQRSLLSQQQIIAGIEKQMLEHPEMSGELSRLLAELLQRNRIDLNKLIGSIGQLIPAVVSTVDALELDSLLANLGKRSNSEYLDYINQHKDLLNEINEDLLVHGIDIKHMAATGDLKKLVTTEFANKLFEVVGSLTHKDPSLSGKLLQFLVGLATHHLTNLV